MFLETCFHFRHASTMGNYQFSVLIDFNEFERSS